jgi:hypothetical protein
MKRAFRPDWDRIASAAMTLVAGAAALWLILDGTARAAALPPPSAQAAPATLPAPATTRYALVVTDTAPLRAGPHDGGAARAQLVQGEFVEVREARLDFVQVWDHRRERGGYVRASQLRMLALTPEEAPELLAQLRLLRERPGNELLGIALAAAWLKDVPAGGLTAEPFDAIGTMAERLARRANTARADDTAVAAQLEAVAAMGVSFDSIETSTGVRLCYDGDAFRHALALHPTPEQAARAALALTRHDCVSPAMTPMRRAAFDRERAVLLDRVPELELPGWLRDRLRVRRAGVWAAVAFEESRRAVMADDAARAAAMNATREAGQHALDALAAVDKAELADDDQAAYAEAAARVGASRWAADALTVPVSVPDARGRLAVLTRPGDAGQTCVLLVDAAHDARAPLARRCTYGTVWAASARANASQTALALAVQPLDTWRELWVFRREASGWTVQALPPSGDEPSVGYVEFAGWVPGGTQMLAAREVRANGRMQRTFELLKLDTLETERRADAPGSLTAFHRWQDAAWKQQTVSVR